MEIAQVLKSFKNAKIILGNGFDLFCGLKTKYSDFFESDVGFHESIKQWCIELNEEKVIYYLHPKMANANDFKPSTVLNNRVTIWDLFFHLISIDDNYEYNWCDIEEAILYSLRKDYADQFRYPIVWNNVYKLCHMSHTDVNCYTHKEILCKAFLKMKGISVDKLGLTSFYEYLLAELKKFEKRFGMYILNQTQKKGYEKNVNTTIGKLVNNKTICTIDTFNYSSLCNAKNINGDTKNPIFGIDSSSIDPKDPIYIFTKIYRRLELDSMKKAYQVQFDFNNIIIFGHSLNEQDYNYFFPLFNKLKINTNEFDGKIIFAYYIYDTQKKEQIKKELFLNIAKMFSSYEKYYNNSNGESRLMEILHLGNKILFNEINNKDIVDISDN